VEVLNITSDNGDAITEDYEGCGSPVGFGRLEADEVAGITRLNAAYGKVTLSSHAALSVHREPAADPPVDPLAVEDRRRLVHAVAVVVPARLVVGTRCAAEDDGRPRQSSDVVGSPHSSLRCWYASKASGTLTRQWVYAMARNSACQ